MPNGTPREISIIQIGSLYYHNPLDTVSIFCMQMAPGPSLPLTPDLPLDLLALIIYPTNKKLFPQIESRP